MKHKTYAKNVRGAKMSITTEKIEQLNYVGKFILLLLGAKDSEPIPGSVHLQKEMYLLQKIIPELADETDYEPDFLGPHSEIVSDEVEQLESSGMVSAKMDRIELTPDGSKAVDMIKQLLDEKEMQKIEEFKEFLNDLTRDELLTFVYFSYPSQNEIEKESVEYNDLLPKRRKLAMSMYQKDKISAQKAAQIAGEHLEDFLERLETWNG